ncbi:hypothetical protein LNTAR_03129 [Lentisphaera araneosa HTCC2155]|uniref:Glycosyltransferase subfamily 4-like N-terminal domain-containing protein n=1 Tax=Lentisphaera araneosa HTCC2155 TaxID=313628 RepID=A6DT13_9BACT|nr:hypothetical protein [Lentisphaera araneosa]EDM25188.1 hypothetical protein LNTAR_03129 [Lentisphaera araneosa HTCC2155]
MIAFFSEALPPSPNGNAVMLHRLLKNNEGFDYCFISSYEEFYKTKSEPLPCEHYYLHEPIRESRCFVFAILRSVFRIIYSVFSLAKLIKSKKIELLVVCTGDLIGIPVGYLASRIKKKPFVLYMFDDYLEQWSGLRACFARYSGRFIIPKADVVIVPNEFIKNKLDNQFGIDCELVRNPSCATTKAEVNIITIQENINILYTGAIYDAQARAIEELSMCLKETGFKLNIFTSSDVSDYKFFQNENVSIMPFVKQSELEELHQQNDILFLPLCKTSNLDSVIMTAAPGKMGEYLASGKIILAFVPENCFVDFLLKKHEAALVCNTLKELRDELLSCKEGRQDQGRLIMNALELSQEFSIEINMLKLNTVILRSVVVK